MSSLEELNKKFPLKNNTEISDANLTYGYILHLQQHKTFAPVSLSVCRYMT